MRLRFGRLLVLAVACPLAAFAAAQEGDRALVSLIRDDHGGGRLDDARRLLARGQAAEGVELLLGLLTAGPSAVVERDADLWVGVREAARDELGRLDGRAAESYVRRAGSEASLLLREALAAKDPAGLAALSLRFPATSWSAAARLAACDLFLEEGRARRALHELALAGPLGGDDVVARRALCRVLLGLPPQASEVSGGWLAVLRAVRPLVDPAREWSAYAGLAPARPAEVSQGPWVEAWTRSVELLADLGQLDFGANLHAVADGVRVFVNTGTRLCAFALEDGHAAWQSPSYLAPYDTASQASFLMAASPSMPHSAALTRDLVVAPLQVPVVVPGAFLAGWGDRRRSPRHLPIRRLHAFQAATGELVWSHYTGDPGQPDPDALLATALDVSGPPLAIDDTVYVAAHRQIGGIAFYVSAFDAHTGRRKWSTLVCSSQIESDRLGQSFTEFAASPLAYEGGVLYGASNLGLCFALRAEDGAIRWARRHEIVPLPAGGWGRGRGRGWQRPQLRTLVWGNGPPVVASGVVVLTPIDSEDALGLEASTGELLWRLPYRVVRRDGQESCELRWLLGAAGGFAWFAGQGLCKVALRGDGTPRLVAEQDADLRDPAAWFPRGFLTEDRIYHPTSQGLAIADHDGRSMDGLVNLPGDAPCGNLCLSRGVLLEVRAGSVRAFRKRDL